MPIKSRKFGNVVRSSAVQSKGPVVKAPVVNPRVSRAKSKTPAVNSQAPVGTASTSSPIPTSNQFGILQGNGREIILKPGQISSKKCKIPPITISSLNRVQIHEYLEK